MNGTAHHHRDADDMSVHSGLSVGDDDGSSILGLNRNREPALIIEVAKVRFRDFFITIYTDSNSRKVPRCFFFEPIVLLDVKSIVHESNELHKQDLVRFTIQMWNAEVRSLVQTRLHSLANFRDLDIQEDDIYVLPFEEVQLVCKPGSGITSIRLLDEPTSYLRLSESLDFYFDCDLPSVAVALADSFRQNPKMILKKWHLELKCRGLALGSAPNGMPESTSSNPNFTYKVLLYSVENETISTRDLLDSMLPRLADLEERVGNLATTTEPNNLLPRLEDLEERARNSPTTSSGVFSVKNCINPVASPVAANNKFFGYPTVDFVTATEFGDMNLTTGIFTVKKPGLYKFDLNSHVHMDNNSCTHHSFELRVNGIFHAHYHNQNPIHNIYQPAVITSLLPLIAEDKVGIFPVFGRLYEDASRNFVTRFSCVFVAEK